MANLYGTNSPLSLTTILQKKVQFSLLGGTLFDGESVHGHPSHRRLARLVCRNGQSDLDLLGVNHVLSRFLPFAAAHRRVLPPVDKRVEIKVSNSGFLFYQWKWLKGKQTSKFSKSRYNFSQKSTVVPGFRALGPSTALSALNPGSALNRGTTLFNNLEIFNCQLMVDLKNLIS